MCQVGPELAPKSAHSDAWRLLCAANAVAVAQRGGLGEQSLAACTRGAPAARWRLGGWSSVGGQVGGGRRDINVGTTHGGCVRVGVRVSIGLGAGVVDVDLGGCSVDLGVGVGFGVLVVVAIGVGVAGGKQHGRREIAETAPV